MSYYKTTNIVMFLNDLFQYSKDLWSNDNTLTSDKRTQVVGRSPIGGICTSAKVSTVEDFGGFQSIPVAAHEMGHK